MLITYGDGANSNIYEYSSTENQVIRAMFRMACRKLKLEAPQAKVTCGMAIDHEWLSAVLDEIERVWLDDIEETENLIMDPPDYQRFKEIKKTIDQIVSENKRRKECDRIVSYSDCHKLLEAAAFFKEYEPSNPTLTIESPYGNHSIDAARLVELIMLARCAFLDNEQIRYTQ